MKYQLKLTSNVEVPDNTKFVLFYTKKTGESKIYALSDIINQDNKYLRANVINSGPRTFFNNKIITLQPVNN